MVNNTTSERDPNEAGPPHKKTHIKAGKKRTYAQAGDIFLVGIGGISSKDAKMSKGQFIHPPGVQVEENAAA